MTNKQKVNAVVNAMETMKFFKVQRLPKEFYELNDEERSEAVKIYRRRSGLNKGRPYEETK